MRLHSSFLLLALWISFAASAKTIQGIVKASDDKEPLISATVYVSPADMKKIGSTASVVVVTDMDGRFRIDVPDKITRIYCNYLGYKTEEIHLTTGQALYAVTMEPTENQLETVVVTGYQKIEKRKLTAAVSRIEFDEKLIGASSSIDQVLAGQIPGLSVINTTGSPTAQAKMRIRGTSSLNGSQDPLWVLDGLPLEGTDIPKTEDLKDINELYNSSIAGLSPADIESITVLKDAAATAIYGARAANGVIVITSKSGKKGKTRVNFSTKISYMPRLSTERLNLLNSDEKVNLELDLLRSPYTYRENKGGVANILKTLNLTDAYKTGGWGGLPLSAQEAINSLRTINTDWEQQLFRDAVNQEYNLSLSGGGDRATYYTSVSYYDEKGSVQGVDANRFNVVAKTTYQFNDRVKSSASLFANRRISNSFVTDYDGFTSPIYYTRRANPYQQILDSYGNYIYDKNIQGMEDSDLDFNILEERNNTSYKTEAYSITSNFDLDIKLMQGLKLYTQLGLQADFNNSSKIADGSSYAMRKDRLRSRRKDLTSNQYYYFLPEGGMHKQTNSRNSQFTWKLQGEYNTTINEIHEIEALLGTELRRTLYESLASSGYGFDRKTLTTKPVIFPKEDDAKLFPLYTESRFENAFASAFSTFSYTLLRRYTLGGSIRFDGSDLFGVDPRYRYLPLYSVSGVWRVKGEPFLRNVDWIDHLAIRASYGLQGNIDKNTTPSVVGNYKIVSMLPGGSITEIEVASPPNDKLRWEKTSSVNTGFDFAVLNQAIYLTFDYYYRYGSDLIAQRSLPLETGFMSTLVNWAEMKNEGIEFGITTRNISTRTFNWTTTLNGGFNRNKILKESVPANQTTPSREGYPVGAIFAYRSGGLDAEGYPLFINKEGNKVTAKELFGLKSVGNDVTTSLTAQQQRDLYSYVGSSEPLISGGFMNTFTLYNFELSANLIFNLGHYVRTTPSYSITKYDRGLNTNHDILNRWSPSNPQSKIPALISNNKRVEEYNGFNNYNYDNSFDYLVKRGDYARLQSVRLAYKFPEEWTKALRINTGSIAVEGRNLLVFGADYNNFLDPETMGNHFAQPIPKQVTFSLNLNF